MMDPHELIAALLDGERVDSSQLAQALAAPDGRDYLIDLLALRELVDNESPAVGREIGRRPSSFRWPWLPLAAAAMVTVTLAGYAIGLRRGHLDQAIRDVPFVAPQASNPLPAPAPTQVIRFQSGVNWQEQIGGH
jgi:hypothetical protein